MAVVVVLPCVPLTTIECFPGRNSSSRVFRQGVVLQLAVEHLLHFHVAAREGVADYYEVGHRRKIRSIKVGGDRDA